MIARIRKSMQEKDQGFTLIELLVVIIIIGILAAIAIPVFMNQRKKAVDAGIKSDLRTIANELETYYTDNQAYPTTAITVTGTTSGNHVVIGTDTVSLSSNNNFDIKFPPTTTYCVYGHNDKGTGGTAGGYTYKSDAGGLQPGAAAASGCP